LDIVDSILRTQLGHAPERAQDYFRLVARRPGRFLYCGIGAAYAAYESPGAIIGIALRFSPTLPGLINAR
jgi:hypothetical protein